jgi:hypothetical protein
LIAYPVLFLWGGVFVGVYTLMMAVVGDRSGGARGPADLRRARLPCHDATSPQRQVSPAAASIGGEAR